MKCLWYGFILLVCVTALGQSGESERRRFYKAECGTAADYLELAKDGTYRVIGREHMGVGITERGRWEQNGTVITFRPESVLRGGKTVSAGEKSYEGTEVKYKNKVFITFNTESAPEIVVPLTDIRQELDGDPRSVPIYVFFQTSAEVFERETKQTYPFRYIKPR